MREARLGHYPMVGPALAAVLDEEICTLLTALSGPQAGRRSK
jgi:hypothetical protein